ncbi:MAG TPA: outer membrane beta-barrel protein, partial [Chitinophagaceae bacterium]
MNKPKRLFLLLLVSMVTLAAQSQVRLGLFGGPHSSSVLEQNSIPGWDTTTKKHYSNSSGVHIGVLLDVPLGKNFYLQPGVGYTSKGNKYAINNDSAHSLLTDTVFYSKTLSINYIEIPLYLTYKLPLSASHKSSFFISAGPYFGFYYNGNTSTQSKIYSTSTYTNTTVNLPVGKGVEQYRTSDMGVNARAGFELGSFVLNGYFSRGLTSFYTASYSGTFQHQAVGASIGFWLSKTEARVPKPKDTDKDGIPDNQDLCPRQPGIAKYNGCPIPDTDHDGINDEQDSCKNIPGVAKYHGCPIPDTDGDGINDGDEVNGTGRACTTAATPVCYHTNPLLADTDNDGVWDYTEVRTGSDPTNAASLNLAAAMDSVTVSPASFTMIVNSLTNLASVQLTVTGHLIDNRTIDLTSTTRGTNYTSSDLGICNFGIPDGRVFASTAGSCTITI